MIEFEFKQVSRKVFALIGVIDYRVPEFETLIDSRGNEHKVEVGERKATEIITPEDCNIKDVYDNANILGSEYSNIELLTSDKMWRHSGGSIWRIPEDCIKGKNVNSVVLSRIFLHHLFGYKGVFTQELKEKGVSFVEGWAFRSYLKKAITNKGEDYVYAGPFRIKLKHLFDEWWTEEIRDCLMKDETDYKYIYKMKDGVKAAAELLRVRSKLRKRMVISYEY